ncbi:uncharacterized protein B0J16DRAFT_412486 [Fusarium flagelliforme]|uniref:uncharacterized protein n=1 Tax=Fusarium flagelliforme TaxID=2675880 RepID=UPI001E8DF130|nr:uncharacterized protein B0J16DRAFT_412486 [Fusarium flagelliforme]KAH7193946.1 hypothetical protein B0J16DRAFT_412486 [Fusarium flagelliforme]
MDIHTIAVEPGDHYWDRRRSGRESPSGSHFLYRLDQEEKSPIQIGDAVFGDASTSIGSYYQALSTLESSVTSPLMWDTATSHFGTSNCDAFTFDPDIAIKFEPSEFDWLGMTDYKDLFHGRGEKSSTTTSVMMQTDGTEDVSRISPPPKMRSASRKPKNLRARPPIPSESRQARDSHNKVEKQYRTRLKYHFERLLLVLQESMPKSQYRGKDGSVKDPYCFSRGEVLDVARQRILALQEENKRLATQVELLRQGLMIE